jgi:hypothetical protein
LPRDGRPEIGFTVDNKQRLSGKALFLMRQSSERLIASTTTSSAHHEVLTAKDVLESSRWRYSAGSTRLAVLGRDIKYISRSLSHCYFVGHGLKSVCFAQAFLLSLGTPLDTISSPSYAQQEVKHLPSDFDSIAVAQAASWIRHIVSEESFN